MEYLVITAFFAVGILAGGFSAWLWRSAGFAEMRARLDVAENESKNREEREKTRREEDRAVLGEFRESLARREEEIRALQSDLQEEIKQHSAARTRAERLPELETRLERQMEIVEEKQNEIARLKTLLAEAGTQLEEERKSAAEKIALLEDAKARLSETFRTLSAEALKSNNESFLQLARENLSKIQETAKGDLDLRKKEVDNLIEPIRQMLDGMNQNIQGVEKERNSAYAGLKEQVESLLKGQKNLSAETGKLVKALRKPNVRGRWGEIQLQRVVEIAGMTEHCDFTQQQSVSTGDGRLRPDMMIRLPNERRIVVDAKAPLEAYLDSVGAESDREKAAFLQTHARHVKDHLRKLGEKAYWDQFDSTPEFVVMFLPGESFFSAALEADPKLIEYGVDQRVILATPTTLIALLKAVAYGWSQEKMAEHARQISELGTELYDRIGTLSEHFIRLGRHLDNSVTFYNKSVATLESNVLTSAKKMKELGIRSKKEPDALEVIERTSREFKKKELLPAPQAEAEETRLPERLEPAPVPAEIEDGAEPITGE